MVWICILFGIIISFLIYVIIYGYANDKNEISWFSSGILLCVIISFIGIIDCIENKQGHKINDVVKYSIDSTIVINGADTTKTYTITYFK